MATTTLKEKAKKVFNTMTGSEPEEESIMFYTDHAALKQWDADAERSLDALNFLLRAMNKYYQVESIDEVFNGLLKNEAEFYYFKHRLAHQEKFKEYDALGIEFKIALPADFDVIRVAARKAREYTSRHKPQYFALANGEIILSKAYYDKRNSKCYLYAEGKEEIELLHFCNSVIQEIEKLEPILLRDKRYHNAVKMKLYALPLPYFLKIVSVPGGERKIIPSPMFIKEAGFAGTSHFGFYMPTKQEKKMAQKRTIPNIGEPYVRFYKKMSDSTIQEFLVPEKDYETKHKNINTTLFDGLYNSQGKSYGVPLELRESMRNPHIGTTN